MTLPMSDASLETIRRRVKQRGTMRDQRYRGRVAQSVSGLAACRCHGQRIGGRGLHGYRVALLNQRTGLSGLGAPTDVALVPVSDTSAVTNAVKYFLRARQAKGLAGFGALLPTSTSDVRSPTRTEVRSPTRTSTRAVTTGNRTSTSTDGSYNTTTNNYMYGDLRSAGLRLAGLGDTAQASGAASGAAAGAKAGSIVPGIGTVIGAVVGAVVGWLSAKPKPVRATAEQIAQCQTLATEYLGYAAQSPGVPLPMELTQIKELTWCGAAIHGGMVKLKDPRYFTSGFDERVAICRQIVRKVYETKVGDTVEISGLSFTDAKGKKISLPGTSFVNAPFTSILELTSRILVPLEIQNCAPWGKAACAPYFDIPLIRRTLFDLLGYAARTELPNISEADLRAASQVAATTGTAARDVVSAVEQIIKRNVSQGETSALLTGQTDVPGVIAPTPTVTVPPSTAPPTIPGITTQAAADVTALISQLVAQNASANQATQAALDALKERGTPITPAVTTSVQKEVAAQQAGGLNTALLTGGGLLAALFLLGRPAARRTRGRK